MEDIIIAKNLTKIYNPGKTQVLALDHLNFTAKQGEFIAIKGVSGSGKSTLLHILGGLDTASEGSVVVLEKDLSTLSQKELAHYRNQNVGYVLQDFGLINYRTIEENVAVPLYIAKTSSKEIRMKVEAALKKAGINDLKKRKIKELSGGQKQRVAIARAIVNDPKIIFADEPTGALDTKTKKSIVQLFKNLKEDGHTVIIVTHDEHVAQAADRVVYIQDGRLSETNSFENDEEKDV